MVQILHIKWPMRVQHIYRALILALPQIQELPKIHTATTVDQKEVFDLVTNNLGDFEGGMENISEIQKGGHTSGFASSSVATTYRSSTPRVGRKIYGINLILSKPCFEKQEE